MKKRTIIALLISILLFAVVFAVALMVGRYSMSVSDFFKAVFTSSEDFQTQRSIIVNLRLPRTLMAALVGIGLSLSGLLYQEIFQNKLTSPDLLGVSTGASVGAAVAILLGLSSIFISVFAFIFGVITVLITLVISKVFKNNSSINLILSGIIVGGFMSGVLSLVKYFADPTTTLSQITYWLMGTFQNAKMTEVYILLPIVGVATVSLLLLSFRFNAIGLGFEEAQTKGINFKLYKVAVIGTATILTAVSVAFCGTIGWVGLVIPHLVRLIGGRDTRRSIPLCVTFGGIFMVVTDILSRTFADQELPLSAITGIIGTAIFIIVMFIKRRDFNVH